MLEEKLRLLPTKPGCYLMKNKDGVIIYVGKAKNLKRRVSSYFNKVHTGKTKVLVDNIVDFEFIVTNTEVESLILEINLIKKYSPKYNILLKDDKTYPYIALKNNNGPSLRIVRSKNRKKCKDRLFGPYPNVVSARNTVDILNRIYPLKKCNNSKDLCLYYHINECLGYCKNKVDKEVTDSMVKEITKVLNGDYKLITKRLEDEMEKASNNLDYEKALELRNAINDIKTTINKQIIVSSKKHNFDVFGYYLKDNFLVIHVLFIRDGILIGKHHKIINDIDDIGDIYGRFIVDFYDKFSLPKEIVINDIVDCSLLSDCLEVPVFVPVKGDVKKILDMANLNAEMVSKEKIELIKRNEKIRFDCIRKLESLLNISNISRIELFDNSHLFGTYYVGGMVVFKDFLPSKNDYRKYKISVDVKDDLSAMKEVVYRRYYRALVEKGELPDLVIVDGGRLQIDAVCSVINSLGLGIRVVGLKKDNKHHTSSLVDEEFNEIKIDDNNLFLYLVRMQDEVHRYAITYHRSIKSKGMLDSLLENVEGIGEVRRKMLLKKYSSINKIKEASVDELSTIIPRDVAESLLKYLNSL